jgi:hypothetical protein
MHDDQVLSSCFAWFCKETCSRTNSSAARACLMPCCVRYSLLLYSFSRSHCLFKIKESFSLPTRKLIKVRRQENYPTPRPSYSHVGRFVKLESVREGRTKRQVRGARGGRPAAPPSPLERLGHR